MAVPRPREFGHLPTTGASVGKTALSTPCKVCSCQSSRSGDEADGYTGSAGHFARDAATCASWGVDFIKFDVYSVPDYRTLLIDFANDIHATGRPMFLYTGLAGKPDTFPLIHDVNGLRFTGDLRRGWYPSLLYHTALLRRGTAPRGGAQRTDLPSRKRHSTIAHAFKHGIARRGGTSPAGTAETSLRQPSLKVSDPPRLALALCLADS